MAALQPSSYQPDGDPREDKKRIDAELARTSALVETASAEAQASVVRLSDLNGRVLGAKNETAQARGLVAAATVSANSAARVSAAAEATASTAAKRYDGAAQQVREGRARLGRFVSVTYQGGDIAQLNSLLSAGSPRDFMVAASYVRKIAESKKDAVQDLRLAERAAKNDSNEATMSSRTAQAAKAAAEAAVAEAAFARDKAEQSERDLAELVTKQEAAVRDAESYRSEILAKHEEARRESERIEAELRAWEQGRTQEGPVFRPGARLLMPVRGWKSSDFGNRYDPYYHVWQLHAGMDIAADGGEPIYAAADGQVASAGWRGGYGNYTCVGHGTYEGRSLSTCYGHQSRILVSSGQWVTRGQLIGRVGTTGASTGNHLHFEVRLDGRPTDPEEWLPGCLC
jgi:murein DD-endopeptidase MepM/ murein hydrolase activator NlpD